MCEVCKDGEVVFVLELNCIEDVLDYVAEHLCIEGLCYECLDKQHYMLYSDSCDDEFDVYYK